MFKIFSTYICRIIYKMQPLEVSGVVRPIYGSLGVKRLIFGTWVLQFRFLYSSVSSLFYYFLSASCEPGSSVDIATDCGLDGPGSNSGGDEIFRPSRPALGPTQPPTKWVLVFSRGQSAAGACC